MGRIWLFFLLLLPVAVFAVDSAAVRTGEELRLKGYRKLFYKIVALHPKLNSPLEKELLQHYLAGSGETFILSTADFKRLQQTVPLFVKQDSCHAVIAAQHNYCYKQVDLNNDAYFGWALGTITVVYNAADNEVVSFVDTYDFNKKKKGLRSRKNEFVTGVFRLLAPARARSFLVTFASDAYLIKQ
ncbi:hypothetical protein IQ13_2879 [Lacibacter cauensis]|uniref:Uncharacterized protein n=1 Tax=Lacibacter cauensis TaxID=510947 RepID=A0A562SFS4_9BACT|nr:hypothetical protein [Lacibacter cauensis]TWI80207.1 hypothetical protein IQ13_2879 [Lacibacter cauensis]